MKYLLFISVLVLGVSCKRKQVSPESFLAYVDDPSNGLIRKEEIGDLVFSFQYRPPAYEVLRNNKSEPALADMFDTRVQEQGTMQYFLFRIGTKAKGQDVLAMNKAGADYNTMIDYFNTRIIDDMKLVDGKDTLPCVIHHWERTYHIAGYQTLMLGFEAPTETAHHNTKTLVYEDQLFGIGRLQLSIAGNDIDNIPQITF